MFSFFKSAIFFLKQLWFQNGIQDSKTDVFPVNYLNFNLVVLIGDAMGYAKQIVIGINFCFDREITVNSRVGIPTISENAVTIQALEKYSNQRINGENDKIVETILVRIQNTISTAIDNFITPRMKLAVKSRNVSS